MPANVPVILRFLQSAVALVVLICSTAGFRKVQPQNGVVTQLGSSEFNFLLLSSFTAWILTGAWAISVHMGRVPPPAKRSAVIFDSCFILAMIVGCVFAGMSDYVSNCDQYVALDVKFLNCTVLKLAVAFTFLLALLFGATLLISINPSLALKYATNSEHLNYDEGKTPDASMAVGNLKDSGFV